MVRGSFPHLVELTLTIDLRYCEKVATAGISRNGLLVLNRNWYHSLTMPEQAAVIAHELLHLALSHHQRLGRCQDKYLANYAMDIIVNRIIYDNGMILPKGSITDFWLIHVFNINISIIDSSSFEQIYAALEKKLTPELYKSWINPGSWKILPTEKKLQSFDSQLSIALGQAFPQPNQKLKQNPLLAERFDLLPENIGQEWFGLDVIEDRKKISHIGEAVLRHHKLKQEINSFKICTSTDVESQLFQVSNTYLKQKWEHAIHRSS